MKRKYVYTKDINRLVGKVKEVIHMATRRKTVAKRSTKSRAKAKSPVRRPGRRK